jgi:hypothetical protein
VGVEGDDSGGADVGVDVVCHESLAKTGENDVV